ncbi:MAG: selenium metabolism-associated LysR family transcriptional regulator [Candidatus Helarchaeota archaeon]
MSLNLHFLDIFTKICEYGSFSKTARELNLSQSAISQQMEVLERYFGVKLFKRSIRGVVLTEEGKILKKYSEIILDNMKLAKMEIAKSIGKFKGTIKISSSTIPGEQLLPKYIIEFKKQNPQIDFQIEVNDSLISLRQLEEGKVDLAAVGTLETPKNWDVIELAEEELMLVIPPHHELAQKGIRDITEILKYQFIFREKTSGTRKETEKILKTAGIEIDKLKIVGELNTTESILTAISEGLGISIVSSIASKKLERTGLVKCLQLPNISAKRKLFLVKKKFKRDLETDNKKLLSFWEFVKKKAI